jgi:hypothetical protein
LPANRPGLSDFVDRGAQVMVRQAVTTRWGARSTRGYGDGTLVALAGDVRFLFTSA